MRHACLKSVAKTLALALIALGPCAFADDKGSSSSSSGEEKRVALAKPAEAGGVLLSREVGKSWKVVGKDDSISSKDMLLVMPGGRATFATKDKDITISLWGNLPLSNVPIAESAVILHANTDVDLDLTFDRGRLLITNSKEKGEAKVRIRVLEQQWVLDMKEPGTTVALDLVARMPAGSNYSSDPKKAIKPIAEVGCIVSKGTVDFHEAQRMFPMRAPPGPAYVRWDGDPRNNVNATRLQKVPEWIDDGPSFDSIPYVKSVVEKLGQQIGEKQTVEGALAGLMTDAKKAEDPKRASMLRGLAIFGFGAVDDIDQLVDEFTDGKTEDAREIAIEALRHWLGRGQGRDTKLYKYLIDTKKFEEKQAEVTIELLYGFEDRQLLQPDTYEVLIAYVKHPRLAVRELAHWHLTRLVPDGNKIKYDPAGGKDEQEKAFKEWKKRVPDGKLPGDVKGS
jgi:hypothetical protein